EVIRAGTDHAADLVAVPIENQQQVFAVHVVRGPRAEPRAFERMAFLSRRGQAAAGEHGRDERGTPHLRNDARKTRSRRSQYHAVTSITLELPPRPADSALPPRDALLPIVVVDSPQVKSCRAFSDRRPRRRRERALRRSPAAGTRR